MESKKKKMVLKNLGTGQEYKDVDIENVLVDTGRGKGGGPDFRAG